MTTTYLQKTVCDYKDHVEQIAKLRQDTAKCLEEFQSLINSDLNRRVFTITLPSLQIPELDLSKRMPCVLFIGSQNCGKSTLLNTFLKYKKLLPASKNPCTSRLVRVVYSSPPSATLVDQMERQAVDFQDRKKYIAFEGDDRKDIEKVKTIVEVGITHELLECGIELIDSPGRNENDALNRVVEEFIQKGIVPLIVYIVDGNNHIQQSDCTAIGKLQDKFPNVTIMFVCSKVDVDIKAHRFDHDSDDDNSDEQLFTLAQKKKIAVFEQLKNLDFIPPDADINTFPLFHGVSAKEVSASRKQNPVLKNAATMSFDNFELCIYEQLESSLRRGSKRVLTTLLSAQETILSSIVSTHRSFAHALTSTSVPGENYDKALEAELSLFTMMLTLVCDKSKFTTKVGHKLEQLSSVFLQEGENYQFTNKDSSKQKLADEFSREVKNAILDRSYSVLKRSFQSIFREVLFQSVAMVTQLTNGVRHPHIRRMMQRIYGYGNEFQKVSDNRSAEGKKTIGIYIELEDILESFKDIVNSALRREISRQLNEFDLSELESQPNPRDQGWRRKVVQCMLLKFDCKRISEEVVRTCKEALMIKHTLFVGKVQELHALKELFLGDDIETMTKHLRTEHVPRVAELAVRGHALRYVIERGPPVLQGQIGSTGHGQLYSCSSPLWYAECDDCMVKVVAKTAVGKEVWNQTMLDIMHTKDIVEKVGECRHLLRLNGWFLPEPGKLFIVMEKAEEDLLAALRRGMSWQKRADVAVDVAKGLEAIHKANYVYQDLKPQNVMITADGTAKVNLCKPEKPFEETKLGFPFHISPEMYRDYRKTATSSHSFDIYAFGSLLWVLCEGSGSARPQAYSNCHDIEAMKSEVCVNGTRPERPPNTPDTWWNLMENCWIGTFEIIDVLNYFDMQRMK